MSLDEQRLLADLQAGAPHALAELRARYAARLTRLALASLADRQRAEELAHDVCVDFALDHAPNLKAAAAIWAYLRVMVVRRARRQALRARAQTPVKPELCAGAPLEDEAIAALDAAKRRAWLAACLEALPARTQRMLKRRFHHDETMRAIGEALALSKQMVSREIGGALERLRRCLARRAR